MGCITAIGYIAFSALTVGPTLTPTIPSLNSAAEQLGAASNGDQAALSPNAAAPTRPTAAPDQNVDLLPAAIPAKATPPDDPTALSAEQLGGAGNGDQAALSPNAAAPAPPSAAPEQNVGAAPARLAEAAPTAPDDPNALSAEQLGPAGKGDRATLSPNAAAPAPPSAAPESTWNFFPVATVQNRYNFADRAAPTAPDGPAALSAEQLGAAGNRDQAALSPDASAPTPSTAAPDQNAEPAPPALLSKAAPPAPDGPAALSAEQLSAASNGDRAALSTNDVSGGR
jgi:hypothetical protein